MKFISFRNCFNLKLCQRRENELCQIPSTHHYFVNVKVVKLTNHFVILVLEQRHAFPSAMIFGTAGGGGGGGERKMIKLKL